MRRIFSQSMLVSSTRVRFFAASSAALNPLSSRRRNELGSLSESSDGFTRVRDDYDDLYDSSLRDLSPASVLRTIRQDPGKTSSYYAKQYFGGEDKTVQLNHVLHTELKKFGKVDIRYVKVGAANDAENANPRLVIPNPNSLEAGTEAVWVPRRRFTGRHHQVHPHRPELEDLSLLENFVPEIPDFLKGNVLPQPPKIPSISGSNNDGDIVRGQL